MFFVIIKELYMSKKEETNTKAELLVTIQVKAIEGYECTNCGKHYETLEEVRDCCPNYEKSTYYQCPHCTRDHDLISEAFDCCLSSFDK